MIFTPHQWILFEDGKISFEKDCVFAAVFQFFNDRKLQHHICSHLDSSRGVTVYVSPRLCRVNLVSYGALTFKKRMIPEAIYQNTLRVIEGHGFDVRAIRIDRWFYRWRWLSGRLTLKGLAVFYFLSLSILMVGFGGLYQYHLSCQEGILTQQVQLARLHYPGGTAAMAESTVLRKKKTEMLQMVESLLQLPVLIERMTTLPGQANVQGFVFEPDLAQLQSLLTQLQLSTHHSVRYLSLGKREGVEHFEIEISSAG